jgi:hypothetical protein
MKEHFRIHEEDNMSVSAQFIEILHKEGIESAEAWLKGYQINENYDRIEVFYLRSKKFMMTH